MAGAIPISSLVALLNPAPTAEIPASENGKTYRIKLQDIGRLSGITKASLGLDKVDNTADVDKPVSKTQALALAGKADKIHTHEISHVNQLQQELDLKADKVHTHLAADITDLDAELSKRAVKQHTHTAADITDLAVELAKKADKIHKHVIADVTGLDADLTAIKADIDALETDLAKLDAREAADYAALVAAIAAAKASITKASLGLDKVDNTADADKPVSTAQAAEFAKKADKIHTHEISDVNNLDTELLNKADKIHKHTMADVTGLEDLISKASFHPFLLAGV